MTIFRLVVSEKPLAFFALLGTLLIFIAVVVAIPIVVEFGQTGLVRRFPTLSIVTILMLAGAVSGVCGLILQTVTNMRRELKRFAYLSIDATAAATR